MSRAKDINVTCLISYTLKKTQHALRLHMDEALIVMDLTTPQYAVLAQLELNPGISNAALAKASFITPQTMHAIVSNLEKRNLIQRTEDPDHGRILRAELTEVGYKIVRTAHEIISTVEEKMTHTFSEKDKILLEKLLNKCFDNLH